MKDRLKRQQLLVIIQDVLADILDNGSLQLTEESTADQVADWDSINQVKLLIALENELNFRFLSPEVQGLKNVGALIDVVQQKLATKA